MFTRPVARFPCTTRVRARGAGAGAGAVVSGVLGACGRAADRVGRVQVRPESFLPGFLPVGRLVVVSGVLEAAVASPSAVAAASATSVAGWGVGRSEMARTTLCRRTCGRRMRTARPPSRPGGETGRAPGRERSCQYV